MLLMCNIILVYFLFMLELFSMLVLQFLVLDLALLLFFFSSFGKQESVRTWYAPAGFIPPGRSLEVSSRNYEVLAIKIPNSAEC